MREHSVQKVPLMFVVGKREAEEGTVSIRRLGTEGQQVQPFMDALVALMSEATPPDLKDAGQKASDAAASSNREMRRPSIMGEDKVSAG